MPLPLACNTVTVPVAAAMTGGVATSFVGAGSSFGRDMTIAAMPITTNSVANTGNSFTTGFMEDLRMLAWYWADES